MEGMEIYRSCVLWSFGNRGTITDDKHRGLFGALRVQWMPVTRMTIALWNPGVGKGMCCEPSMISPSASQFLQSVSKVILQPQGSTLEVGIIYIQYCTLKSGSKIVLSCVEDHNQATNTYFHSLRDTGRLWH